MKSRFFLLFWLISFSLYGESFVETWIDTFTVDVPEYAGGTAFPLLDIPFGGRYEAMGGAYTAVGGDAGSLEANPSGTALSAGPVLSFFHHEWIADSAIESVVFITSTGPIGLGIGAKYFRVPFTEYDSGGGRVSSGTFTEVVGIANASLRFVNTEYLSISAGANVKVAFRHVPESIVPDQTAVAVPFDLGLLSDVRFLDFSSTGRRNLGVGFSVRNVGAVVELLDSPLPTALSGGVSYSPFSFLLLSGDVSVPIDLSAMAARWQDLSYAAGVSVRFARFLDIHSGARIEAASPGFSLGATVHLGQLSFDAIYSTNLALGLNPLDSLSIGAALDLAPEKDRVPD